MLTLKALAPVTWDLSDTGLVWIAAFTIIVASLVLAAQRWPTFYLLLRIVVAAVLALSLLGALVFVAGFPGLLIWTGLLIVGLTLLVQLPRARRRATLDLLTLAIEKRMPLSPVIRAFAADHWSKRRLLRLADDLDRGMPLKTALEAEKGLLPREGLAAAKMGEATGDLAGAFRQARATDVMITPLRQAFFGHTLYLVSLAFVIPLLFTFVMVFIIPKYIAIFDDFGIALPNATVWMVITFRLLSWAGFCLPIVGAAALIYVVLCYAEFWPLPALSWGLRFERGRLLRALALATESQRPLSETLVALAQDDSQPQTARRLLACGYEVRAGTNWTISLMKHGLIGLHDAVLIDAAGRLHNLPWALREAADGNDRRLMYRLEAAMNVVSPLVVLGWGAIIFVFAVGCFLPVARLIQALSIY